LLKRYVLPRVGSATIRGVPVSALIVGAWFFINALKSRCGPDHAGPIPYPLGPFSFLGGLRRAGWPGIRSSFLQPFLRLLFPPARISHSSSPLVPRQVLEPLGRASPRCEGAEGLHCRRAQALVVPAAGAPRPPLPSPPMLCYPRPPSAGGPAAPPLLPENGCYANPPLGIPQSHFLARKITFPIVWSLMAVLRSVSSVLVWDATGRNLLAFPLVVFVVHLCIGDTWNYIQNTERRMGVAAVGSLFVLGSAATAVHFYYRTLEVMKGPMP